MFALSPAALVVPAGTRPSPLFSNVPLTAMLVSLEIENTSRLGPEILFSHLSDAKLSQQRVWLTLH